MVYGERHLCSSPTPGREVECDGRRGIQGSERQIGLDVLPTNFPEDQSPVGTTGNRSICFEAINPTANICELETGPGSNGQGRLHNILDRHEGICQSTMESSGQGPGPSSATRGGTHSNSPSMKISTLVPSVAGNVCGPSQVAPDGGQPNPTNTPPGETRPSAPASCVEYLRQRQRYKHQQLSEKAMELMLSSWREKSSKAYESQFQKWASWCGARSIDPISCPIGNVVNFPPYTLPLMIMNFCHEYCAHYKED